MVNKAKSAELRRRFMQTALDAIVQSGVNGVKHPLKFLVNPTTGTWFARRASSEEPTVQAGHLVSRHSEQPERFALEDSTFNQVSSNKGETQGAVFFKTAVSIGNVPVELRTATTWESIGELPAGTLTRSNVSTGWDGSGPIAPLTLKKKRGT
jgi:hypothetical protein